MAAQAAKPNAQNHRMIRYSLGRSSSTALARLRRSPVRGQGRRGILFSKRPRLTLKPYKVPISGITIATPYGVWHKPNTASMPSHFPLEINPSLGVPIYRQVVDGIREMIAAGQLHPGDQLPSIRELSRQLRINPSSCVKAYNHLRDAGLIEGDQGRGTFVANQPNLAAQSRDLLLERDLQALLHRARARGSSDKAVLAALKALIDQRKESS